MAGVERTHGMFGQPDQTRAEIIVEEWGYATYLAVLETPEKWGFVGPAFEALCDENPMFDFFYTSSRDAAVSAGFCAPEDK